MSAKSNTSTKKTANADTLKGLKVAIVHDWLYGGGAELVVEQLHKMFPAAPIYVSWTTDEWRKRLDNKVVTGFLQHQPFRKFYKFLGFLRIRWYSSLNFEGYDLVISSSGAEAKGIYVPEGTVHVNYCHAPTHYYWSRYDEYVEHPGFGPLNFLARIGLFLLVRPLRTWDYAAAQRPDYLIANSTHIQAEIQKYYGRASEVIFPPVAVERFATTENYSRYGYVVTGRQTPYKRLDLAVMACTQLKVPLKVIGRKGPEYTRLTSLAGPTVRFLTNVSDAELPFHLQSAEAFIFPGLDDFGITPIEAMAAGTPVVAYKGGGALDYVKPGTTGEFFEAQTVESLVSALSVLHPSSYNHKKVSRSVAKFSAKQFTAKMEKALVKCVSGSKKVAPQSSQNS